MVPAQTCTTSYIAHYWSDFIASEAPKGKVCAFLDQVRGFARLDGVAETVALYRLIPKCARRVAAFGGSNPRSSYSRPVDVSIFPARAQHVASLLLNPAPSHWRVACWTLRSVVCGPAYRTLLQA